MDAAAPVRTNAIYNVLVVLLIAGLATGVALMFMATGGSAAAAEVQVGAPEPVDCPFGSGAPVCYRYEIANTGGADAFVRCEITPSGDTTAVFGNGETVYEGAAALPASETWQLYVQVQPGEGDVVTEPMVGCAASA